MLVDTLLPFTYNGPVFISTLRDKDSLAAAVGTVIPMRVNAVTAMLLVLLHVAMMAMLEPVDHVLYLRSLSSASTRLLVVIRAPMIAVVATAAK